MIEHAHDFYLHWCKRLVKPPLVGLCLEGYPPPPLAVKRAKSTPL